jgi:hypothetical protein
VTSSPLLGVSVLLTANPLWTDSGLTVSNGDHVIFPAAGHWDPGNGVSYGPEGSASLYGDWLQNTPWAGLLGFVGPNPHCDDRGTNRWGDPTYFPRPPGTNYWYVGTNVQFTATRAGELWFGFNDDAIGMAVWDNSGVVYGPLIITNR